MTNEQACRSTHAAFFTFVRHIFTHLVPLSLVSPDIATIRLNLALQT